MLGNSTVNRRGLVLILVGMMLALSLVGNILQALSVRSKNTALEELGVRPPSSPLDAPFVNRAFVKWAAKNGVSPARAMNGRYARVVRLEREVCVSLNMELGGVGGIPVYCFDVNTRALTRESDNIE